MKLRKFSLRVGHDILDLYIEHFSMADQKVKFWTPRPNCPHEDHIKIWPNNKSAAVPHHRGLPAPFPMVMGNLGSITAFTYLQFIVFLYKIILNVSFENMKTFSITN